MVLGRAKRGPLLPNRMEPPALHVCLGSMSENRVACDPYGQESAVEFTGPWNFSPRQSASCLFEAFPLEGLLLT